MEKILNKYTNRLVDINIRFRYCLLRLFVRGSASKETDGESAKTVKILRDTGCMQSFILTDL